MKMDGIKLCLSTEAIDTVYLNDLLPRLNTAKPMYIAIGPEKGWDFTDLEIFKALDFQFVKLKGNILRTETPGLVIGSIIKYIKGEL